MIFVIVINFYVHINKNIGHNKFVAKKKEVPLINFEEKYLIYTAKNMWCTIICSSYFYEETIMLLFNYIYFFSKKN